MSETEYGENNPFYSELDAAKNKRKLSSGDVKTRGASIYLRGGVPSRHSLEHEVIKPIVGQQCIMVEDSQVVDLFSSKSKGGQIEIKTHRGKEEFKVGSRVTLQPDELDPVEVEIVSVQLKKNVYHLKVKKIPKD